MRKKTTLIRGMAGLALSASLFLGCQDFLSEDKSAQAATTPSEENIQLGAQEASIQEPSSPEIASGETPKDMPAETADSSKPAASEPATAPAVPDNASECKEIYAQMQSAKDPLYGELKNKFGGLKCDMSQAAGPAVPPDSATVCKNLRFTLATLEPTSTKYPLYLEQIALYCTDATNPAAPVAPPSTPAASDNAAECKQIFSDMQTAKDPHYGELKNKFTALKCDMSQAAGPAVPPDSATVCNNLTATLATLDPNGSKYPLYLEQIAAYCTAKP